MPDRRLSRVDSPGSGSARLKMKPNTPPDSGRARLRRFAVLAEQRACDFVGKQFGRLINRKDIGPVVQPDTSTTVRAVLAECLAETQPPRGTALLIVIIVEQFEQIVTGESQERIAVDDSGARLRKRVGAEAMLVDFQDELSVKAVRAERRRIRAHVTSEVANRRKTSVRLNTHAAANQSDASA